MAKYEIEMTFTAWLNVEADSKSEAIEKAMNKAHDNYGSEVYEYATFTNKEAQGNE